MIHNFEQIYIDNFDYIVKYSMRFFQSDKDRATDHAQNVFLQAWNKKHQFRGESSVKTWLCAIAKNMFYMSIRTKEHDAIHINYEDHYATMCTNPQIITKIEIENILDSIPEGRDKQIFLQAIVQGFNQSELSTMFNISKSAIRCVIHRNRVKIKQKD